ncbi:MAG: HIT family protein [Promethearchaeota archaeon]
MDEYKKMDGLFKDNLLAQNKMEYIKKRIEQEKEEKREECIFCRIQKMEIGDKNYKIYQGQTAFVILNKYPYNPGHLMVIPNRHIKDFRDLNEKELKEMQKLIMNSQNILDELYHPSGYNIGLNIGNFSGASISHLHVHIVPRYKSELGYIDIIGKTRILVDNIDSVYKKMMNKVKDFF